MPRPLREDYEGAWHHVMNRGRSRGRVFLDDDDAVAFLDLVGDTVERFGIEVHAYSLMPNHYHLLVRIPLGNLSQAMRHLGSTYTQAFNRRHRRDGALFRGRFRSQLVKYEAYLMYLVGYIHLNPLRAGLITRLDGLRGWTSHRRYVGKDRHPEWLSTEVIDAQFDSSNDLKEWVLGLHRGATEWPAGLGRRDGWFSWHLCPVDAERLEVDDTRRSVPVDELLEAVCQITGAHPSRLRESIRGPGGNPERRFAVWALRSSTYLTYRQVGEALGMTAQHVARDVRRSRSKIGQFEKWADVWIEKYPGKVSNV